MLKFFIIPAQFPEKSEAELNRFIDQHQVVNIDKNFIQDGANSFWSICVTTAEGPTSGDFAKGQKKQTNVDYKEILSPEDFSVYAELRNLRKQIAEVEGIPAYAVFTNAQLARIVTENIRSNSALSAVEGVGPARIDKYGKQFFARLEQCRQKITSHQADRTETE